MNQKEEVTAEEQQALAQNQEPEQLTVVAESEGEVVDDDPEEPDDGVPRVLVTGASGYLATHLIKLLLQDGRFRVRGTVRNLKKKEKVQPLRDMIPNAKYPLRLVQADLGNAESWKKAVESCLYVFHVASPFPPPSTSVTDDDIVPIAVDGTRNVLQACADAGTVKRVILTSSVSAISCGDHGSPDKPLDYVYTEADWSPESGCAPYDKSKLKAEQAAWEFVKNLEENRRFELAVLNPVFIQGPLLSLASGQGSMAICQDLLNNQVRGIPDLCFPLVDVRDMAKAHIAAMEKPEAAGNRYILVSDYLAFKQIAQIISDEFKPQGYKIPLKSLPKPLLWVAKFFDQDIKSIYPNLGRTARFNNAKMVGELGVTPYAVKDSIIDTCYSLIELNGVKKTPGYLGHPSTRPLPTATVELSPEQPDSATPCEQQTPSVSESKSDTQESEITVEPPASTKTPASTEMNFDTQKSEITEAISTQTEMEAETPAEANSKLPETDTPTHTQTESKVEAHAEPEAEAQAEP